MVMLESTSISDGARPTKGATLMEVKGSLGNIVILVSKLPGGETFSGTVVRSDSTSYVLGKRMTNIRTCNFTEFFGQVNIVNR